jgi:hypothetical protein
MGDNYQINGRKPGQQYNIPKGTKSTTVKGDVSDSFIQAGAGDQEVKLAKGTKAGQSVFQAPDEPGTGSQTLVAPGKSGDYNLEVQSSVGDQEKGFTLTPKGQESSITAMGFENLKFDGEPNRTYNVQQQKWIDRAPPPKAK